MANENRFGISLLSKSNSELAYDDEVMIDKKTGEVLVKTTDGDIISYDYLNRSKIHLNSMIKHMEDNNLKGSIMRFTEERFCNLPKVLSDNDLNLTLNNEINLHFLGQTNSQDENGVYDTPKMTYFTISLDLDVINTVDPDNTYIFNPKDIGVNFSYNEFFYDDTSSLTSKTNIHIGTYNLYDFNRKVFSINKSHNSPGIMIVDLEIKNYHPSARFILNDILIGTDLYGTIKTPAISYSNVQNLYDISYDNSVPSQSQLLPSIIFGDKDVKEFNKNITYNSDELVYIDGKVYICKKDGTKGEFDITKWDEYKLDSVVGGGVEFTDNLSDDTKATLVFKTVDKKINKMPI